ncbi:hypothetical protein [Aquincola sp. J276]|uniref:hypothetical protein n=1 Tax=Aquincola sp. J276 TaxID=2898432 RepID=UPI002150DF26|nr:hypothetical protein [Aquincola sp. J276]MCR5865674.1 hypothetical protein [Aquincola sp. J276]
MNSDSVSAQNEATAHLCKVLDLAIDYELKMERALANEPGFASTRFYPAAVEAYRRIRLLLDGAVTRQTLERVHAELFGVFEQEHYGGIQFQFCAMQIDEWLDAMDAHHGLPSFYDVIHDRLFLSRMDAGPLRPRQYLMAQQYMERRHARQLERKARLLGTPVAPSYG